MSLVFGVIFCGIAGLWALVAADALSPHSLRVAVPVMLIAAGVAGVVSSLLRKSGSTGSGSAQSAAGDESTGSPTRSST